ncbi:DUF5392 family protein [Aquibacillus saliphilus]|uniref:DUF5392 family protein n=1 Tax=Aquibacillus saliphilus TaxID=1909422 RepID=UPI001CEFF11E|nr:DUF5392 family protein [Aquibacillus saliphilus]
MKFAMNDMPHFIKVEIEKLEGDLEPLTKKAARYSFWSLPLIIISFFNLFFLLFVMPGGPISSAILYALLGAIGLALSKEANYHQKEIMKCSIALMVDRINKSDDVKSHVKEKYTTLVQNQSMKAISYFVEFLEEENRAKKLSYF